MCSMINGMHEGSARMFSIIMEFLGNEPLKEKEETQQKDIHSKEKLGDKREKRVYNLFFNFLRKRWASFLSFNTLLSEEEFNSRDLTRHLTTDQRRLINRYRISAATICNFIQKL